MGKLGYFLRLAGVLFVLSLLTLFFTEAGTLEFKVTVLSAVVSFLVLLCCAGLMIRDGKRL